MAHFTQQHTGQRFPSSTRLRSGTCQQCQVVDKVAQLQVEIPGAGRSPTMLVCPGCMANFVVGAPTLQATVYLLNKLDDWQAVSSMGPEQ